MRGDVPSLQTHIKIRQEFSPRARGCSDQTVSCSSPDVVFPACAGMFRSMISCFSSGTSFPRVRGDVPFWLPRTRKRTRFSPRARGCSCGHGYEPVHGGVFPACAGMFLLIEELTRGFRRFPRVRGDVPCSRVESSSGIVFSPRARGCSSPRLRPQSLLLVFPACAGMFPLPNHDEPQLYRFPRVRGDVPPRSGWLAM